MVHRTSVGNIVNCTTGNPAKFAQSLHAVGYIYLTLFYVHILVTMCICTMYLYRYSIQIYFMTVCVCVFTAPALWEPHTRQTNAIHYLFCLPANILEFIIWFSNRRSFLGSKIENLWFVYYCRLLRCFLVCSFVSKIYLKLKS